MEPAERLAAYLADELPTDERAALEAALARDAGLRAALDAMRRADTALAAVPPAALPEGAEDRLRAALAPELDAHLGTEDPVGAAPPTAVVTDLASRRRRWVPGLAAAAAALAAVVGGVTVLGDNDLDQLADAADEAPMATMEALEADGAAPLEGPVLLASGRALDEATAAELLETSELFDLAARRLGPDDGRELGRTWAAAFDPGVEAYGAGRELTQDDRTEGPTSTDLDDPVEGDVADAERAEDDHATAGTSATAVLRTEGPVDGQARGDVAACLEVLLAGEDAAIVTFAELVSFDGEEAVAFGLVTPSGRDGPFFDRREVWVLARGTCEVRYFTQA